MLFNSEAAEDCWEYLNWQEESILDKIKPASKKSKAVNNPGDLLSTG